MGSGKESLSASICFIAPPPILVHFLYLGYWKTPALGAFFPIYEAWLLLYLIAGNES